MARGATAARAEPIARTGPAGRRRDAQLRAVRRVATVGDPPDRTPGHRDRWAAHPPRREASGSGMRPPRVAPSTAKVVRRIASNGVPARDSESGRRGLPGGTPDRTSEALPIEGRVPTDRRTVRSARRSSAGPAPEVRPGRHGNPRIALRRDPVRTAATAPAIGASTDARRSAGRHGKAERRRGSEASRPNRRSGTSAGRPSPRRTSRSRRRQGRPPAGPSREPSRRSAPTRSSSPDAGRSRRPSPPVDPRSACSWCRTAARRSSGSSSTRPPSGFPSSRSRAAR